MNQSRRVRKLRVIALIATSLLVIGADDAFARRYGGFSSRGFSSGRSFSRSSGSLWGSSSRATRSTSTWGRTRSTGATAGTTTRRTTLSGSRSGVSASNTRSISRNDYQRAQRNGTTYRSRGDAESAFRQRYSSQYPSQFSSRPGARPSHIPGSTTLNGRAANVQWVPSLGGYGYRHPTLGTWVLYSAMADAAMMGTLMAGRGYYYGAPPGSAVGGVSRAFWNGLVILVIFMVVSSLLRRSGGRS